MLALPARALLCYADPSPTMLSNLKRFRRFAAPVVVLATVAFFIYFFATHQKVRDTLAHTNPWVLLEIGVLYGLLTLCLVWVYDATLRLCGKRLPFKEQFLLTSYSTIANFFGPLQSGPGVRAAYLKQKHGVNLRDYTQASLLYYAMFSTISALFILVGSGKYWPLASALVVLVAVGSTTVVWFARKQFTRRYGEGLHFAPRLSAELFVATLVQLTVWSVIFYVELSAIHSGAKLTQAIAYGGTANFAVFVAMTPGAIGFREAFLGFSQRVHGINLNGILAANLLDRAVYVAFLGTLFLVVLAFHAGDRFRVKKSISES
jgi:uncharacterized membrane protein YbhN (UPF0104 family)